MKLAYFWLTEPGHQLAERLQKQFGGVIEPKELFARRFQADFEAYDGLVCIMAAGIVVRHLAPLIQSKASDPAVIVLDQQGQHVISLLSGHLGGANRLTRQMAAYLGAEPVITTATDVAQVPAFDLIAVENGLAIENLSGVKDVSSALLTGEPVEVCCTLPVETQDLPSQLVLCRTPESRVRVVISEQLLYQSERAKTLYLRPKNLVLGVGCKRDTPPEHLYQCMVQLLGSNGLSLLSVGKIATIGLKQNEPAIRALCKTLDVPLEIVGDQEIQNCESTFATSAFVRQVTGVSSVAEACSYLAAGRGTMLTGKVKFQGVTLALCRMESDVNIRLLPDTKQTLR